ncbi:hypothetical protein RRG08_021307 [Elysia crispata]|uniref:Uncharacterized protein n=1 Tax=Elysia crispata TaxID=231223 RepID=A0AAE1DDQ2_9GAST|nr:hypothetical protein RRG08_021307 [Elysia crispata]
MIVFKGAKLESSHILVFGICSTPCNLRFYYFLAAEMGENASTNKFTASTPKEANFALSHYIFSFVQLFVIVGVMVVFIILIKKKQSAELTETKEKEKDEITETKETDLDLDPAGEQKTPLTTDAESTSGSDPSSSESTKTSSSSIDLATREETD